jgi:nicotinate phosphoribosyltransferase
VELYRQFHIKIRTTFGIGTWLTNDMEAEAPQIVIKMVEYNGKPVAKVSDSDGKVVCEDQLFGQNLRKVFKLDT